MAIAGAGYTGLWTAYYLHEIDPALRIAIVEREIAGFGASGRNGGWCSALFPPASSGIARRHGLQAAVAVRRAMHESLVEVGPGGGARGHRGRLRARRDDLARAQRGAAAPGRASWWRRSGG